MNSPDIYVYLRILGRRKFLYFLAVLVFLGLTLSFSYNWSTYVSTGTIQVLQADIPEGMSVPIGADASSLIEALAVQQIQQNYETVTSISSLADIITKMNLYPEKRQTASVAGLAAYMRTKIKIDSVPSDLQKGVAATNASNNAPSTILAFQITFSYTDPLLTQQVTNELVTRMLDEDLKRHHNQTQATIALLDSQIADLETSMAQQEKKIADYRSTIADSGPESLTVNQQAAMSTFASIQSIQSQIATLQKSQGDIRIQLAGVDPYTRVVADGQVLTTPSIELKALKAKYATISAQYGPDHPDVVKLRHQIEALQADVGGSSDRVHLQSVVTDLKTNLAAAEKTYGPKHPDVVALRRQLAVAQQNLSNAGSGGDPEANGTKRDADNPAYIMLQSQLQANDAQYKSLVAQQTDLQAQYDRYQQNIAETPAHAQELAALSRDYDNSQIRFRELKEKRLTASMTEQMEATRSGARLAVIDPPELPGNTKPSKMILYLASVVGSGVAALGVVLLAETLSRTVHGTYQLTDIMGEPPLIVVPYIATRRERMWRRQRWVLLIVVLILIVIAAFMVVNQFVTPLDVLFSHS